MKIDWKLKGSNLLRFGCGKDTLVHPETCSDVILMGHNGSQSLTDWITKDTTTGLDNSLTDWIKNSFIKTVGDDIVFEINADYTTADENWDNTNSVLIGTINEGTSNERQVRVPYGSNSSCGVFQVGEGLQATDGVLAAVPYGVFTTTKNGLVPKSSTNTNRFLKGDGTWDIPTNTTYSADEESVFKEANNTFYAPHQFSKTTDTPGIVTNSLGVEKYKKINHAVVGIPVDDTGLIKDLTDIFETIAGVQEKSNSNAIITYSYNFNKELFCTLDVDSAFLTLYKKGKIVMNVYGDIEVLTDDISDLPSSANYLTFNIGLAGTNVHCDITFNYIVVKDIVYLDIISTSQSGVAITSDQQ